MKQKIIIHQTIIQKVITVQINVVIFQEDKEQHEKAKRRQDFEKAYAKRVIKNVRVSEELIVFSNTIEREINEFKQKKLSFNCK